MKTFAINTLGCKVNQYESHQVRELLERLGLTQVETTKSKPELVVVNTCCVTRTASAKSRRYVRKAQLLNPDAVIVVTGCLPTVQTGELGSPGKNVHLISHQDDLAAALGQIVRATTSVSGSSGFQAHQDNVIRTENVPKIKHKNKFAAQPKLTELTSFKGHTRAFLKIQDGCDGCCSYCIIPKARSYVHSKPVEVALHEAQVLVEAGHREIVITGVFLGAYGQESVRRKNRPNPQEDKLAHLLDKMAQIPNLARIRLSSLEPADVTPQLLGTFCRHPNIMPHLHLSLQSGSNTILKKMRRQYTVEEFKHKVELIRSQLDRPAITTDIIVGFPGETDADFRQTLAVVREIGFAKMHVFRFSARKGTAAAVMQDTVDNRVIKERSKTLRNLDAELGRKFREQFVGQTATILVENGNCQLGGRSERYFMVHLEKTGPRAEKNELVMVELVKNSQDGAVGHVVKRESWRAH